MVNTRLCILENDDLEGHMAECYGRIGHMFEQLFRTAGFEGAIDIFNARRGEYPDHFEGYAAILLTGSRADAFSDEDWIVRLREQVSQLLQDGHRLLGVCFGHQLIAHCLGAPVGRAEQGWGLGRQTYDWRGPEALGAGDQIALLASHQDQVKALPEGATLLASNAHCPIAAFALGQQVFCVQPHPEFTPELSAFLLEKRRHLFGEAVYQDRMASLAQGHQGLDMARFMLDFVQGRASLPEQAPA